MCDEELWAQFVFSINGPKQNARSLLMSNAQPFMLFHMVARILFSRLAAITAYFKDSDWLLKNFDQ